MTWNKSGLALPINSQEAVRQSPTNVQMVQEVILDGSKYGGEGFWFDVLRAPWASSTGFCSSLEVMKPSCFQKPATTTALKLSSLGAAMARSLSNSFLSLCLLLWVRWAACGSRNQKRMVVDPLVEKRPHWRFSSTNPSSSVSQQTQIWLNALTDDDVVCFCKLLVVNLFFQDHDAEWQHQIR